MTRIHTPKDTYDHISLTAIENCYDVASKAIVECTFTDDFIILYYKECILISIIGT